MRTTVKTINQIGALKGKKILLRADFNVPIDGKRIGNDIKMQRTIPTIRFLQKRGAAILIVSHLGRPNGFEKSFSLRPVAAHLKKLLGEPVTFFSGTDLERVARYQFKPTEVAMLDNIRFFPGEQSDDPAFANKLARLADIAVFDHFGVSHHAAASVSGVAKMMPAYAGFLLKEEVDSLNRVLDRPTKPLVAIIGGAKIETKVPVLKQLLRIADYVLLGGGPAITCLFAKGYVVGSSLAGENFQDIAHGYLKNKKIILPVDVVVGEKNGNSARVMKLDRGFVVKSSRQAIYDIGPETIRLFSSYIRKARTIIWNGAMGFFEQHPYEYGTNALAHLIARRSKGKAFGVVGGGETVEVVQKFRLENDIDLVSTGGGAMLEYIAGKKLPGIARLLQK